MLESRKLRTLMDLVAVELPASGISLSGKPTKLGHIFLSRRLRSEILQIMPDELVQVHPHSLRHLLGSLGELLVNGEGQGHFVLLLEDTTVPETDKLNHHAAKPPKRHRLSCSPAASRAPGSG